MASAKIRDIEKCKEAERRGGERQDLPPGSRLLLQQQGTDRKI